MRKFQVLNDPDVELLLREGDLYRGPFRFCDKTKQWVGNPADAAEVQDLIKSLNNKSAAEGGERTHSVAITYKMLEKMISWSNETCPHSTTFERMSAKDRIQQTEHICFRAFMSSAWTLWTRRANFIISNLL